MIVGLSSCDAEFWGKGCRGQAFFQRKSPCPTLRPSRDKLGVGVRHTLFPALTLGVSLSLDCQLPDAILHGKRSLRPRSRAVQRLASTGFRVRLFSSLGLVVAPPACEPS